MKIYFVRHGQSYVNITREFSYKLVDKPLTPKGIKQAKEVAQTLANKQIDFIYSSPMIRALETAHWIGTKTKNQIESIEAFRELNVGDLERHPPSDESWEQFFEVWHAWDSGNHEKSFPEGENYNTLLERMKNGLKLVLQSSYNTVVIVGHGGIFCQCLPALLTNLTREDLKHKDWPNTGIIEAKLDLINNNVQGPLISMNF
ncbi:histidine phosphatase family protein [Candidatus Lokiarchaeum ossiferum]|uniref:histidine phosphatase family protein n=1 Tax=Candidatus Lokiarchaeum ossiferum TaxID=2951803 RepID=UPI00352F05D9